MWCGMYIFTNNWLPILSSTHSSNYQFIHSAIHCAILFHKSTCCIQPSNKPDGSIYTSIVSYSAIDSSIHRTIMCVCQSIHLTYLEQSSCIYLRNQNPSCFQKTVETVLVQ